MKSNKPLLIGCLIFPLILVFAFGVGFCNGFQKMSKGTSVPSNAWLTLDLGGAVPDYNELQSSGLLGTGIPATEDLVKRIIHAAKDKRIQGLLITPGFFDINYVNLDELNRAIQTFKKSGKPVLAYADVLSQKDYMLCAMADSLWLNPSASGGILLEGTAANILFYKEALQKLGVKMHVMQSGDYKGAGEPYTNTELSAGTRENLERALKARYDGIIANIAANRKINPSTVREVFEERDDLFISADYAKEYGLIDHTGNWDEFCKHYNITKKSQVRIKNYQPHTAVEKQDQVAVVYLSGEIATDLGSPFKQGISSAKTQKIVKSISQDKSIKAVVLRINSPGGSALESEIIYQQFKDLGRQLPVVISMGGTAASGGYYISCAGQHIFADAATITGSIGVIMALPETKELGSKLGVRSQTIRFGKFAAPINLFETYDPEILASFRRSSEAVYTEFKQRVSDARQIPLSRIHEVAEGRVWSAQDALDLKLIDAIGSLEDAIAKAASLAKISDYSIRNYPSQTTLLQVLREEGIFSTAGTLIKARNTDPAEVMKQNLLNGFSPQEWLYRCPWHLD